MRLAAIIVFCLAVPAIGFSATLLVPSQYSTIQGAINAALNGDTVLVSPGTYVENIDFIGKAITVISEKGAEVTIIDGGNPANPNYGSVVIFQNAETLDSVLDGFTITNGTGTWYANANRGGGISCWDYSSPTLINNIVKLNSVNGGGGGIFCRNNASPSIMGNIISENSAVKGGGGIFCFDASPTIANNLISQNTAWFCGGVYCGPQTPTVMNNIITGNAATSYGGGMYCYGSSAVVMGNDISDNTTYHGGAGIWCTADDASTITNNTISGNSSIGGGGYSASSGGIGCFSSSPTISNSTIFGNSAVDYGGGIYCNDSSIIVTDTILWNNTASTGPEVYLSKYDGPSTLTISYSDVEGGKASCHAEIGCNLIWGLGMIDADPIFVVGLNGLYYLSQGAAGQYMDSPCVDTGSDLASNLGMDTLWTRTDGGFDSGTVDMGFHHGPLSAGWTVPLYSDTYTIPETVGGTANFVLTAGTDNANRNYILLGSVSGTEPGTPLPGGMAVLPLNWDFFTNVVLQYLNSPIFKDFMGILDNNGTGTAQFNIGPVPGVAPLTMYFAYALNGPWDFASNPVLVDITP